MLSLNNHINMLKMLQINLQSPVENKRQEASLIDYTNPMTFEIAERLRVQFAGLKQQAQEKVVQNAITREFGKDMPAIKSMIKEDLFPGSNKSQKTLGIV